LHSLNACLLWFSNSFPCPKKRLSGLILSWSSALPYGFSQLSPLESLFKGTSPGVPFPYSALRRKSLRPVGFPPSLWFPSFVEKSQLSDYDAAHRLSQPFSDFFLSQPSNHFQAGNAPGVFPSGILSSHVASLARHQRPALLIFSCKLRLPITRSGHSQARLRLPRYFAKRLFYLQGLFPHESRSFLIKHF